jgi:SnoaL-like domain
MGSATTSDGSLEVTNEVQKLVDEAAICRVHLDYCRGIDRRDWELVRTCYHADAIDHHGAFSGGVDEFIAWALEVLESVTVTTHFVGNQIVDIDGDVAWHEAYCRAFHRMRGTATEPALDWVINVRYLDRMERRAGTWKIADRLVVHDSDRRDLVPGTGQVGQGWCPGRFSPDDPSYSRPASWADFLSERRLGD